MQGDPELNYAHFALQRLRILPSDLNNMSQRERAFIYASIDLRVEEEKREAAKVRS
nr:MAG TPA: hypothetical protein [Caudoviricetes sp.]